MNGFTHQEMTKAFIWLLPIIFTAGGLMWQLGETQDEVQDLGQSFDSHERLRGHPVVEAKLDDHEEVLRTLVSEQREIMVEQRGQAVDISAICQATGARCE